MNEAVGRAVDELFETSERKPFTYSVEELEEGGRYRVSVEFSDGSVEYVYVQLAYNAVNLLEHLRKTGGQWIEGLEVLKGIVGGDGGFTREERSP